MILNRPVGLWLATAYAIVNVLVIVAGVQWTTQQIGVINVAVSALFYLAANSQEAALNRAKVEAALADARAREAEETAVHARMQADSLMAAVAAKASKSREG